MTHSITPRHCNCGYAVCRVNVFSVNVVVVVVFFLFDQEHSRKKIEYLYFFGFCLKYVCVWKRAYQFRTLTRK